MSEKIDNLIKLKNNIDNLSNSFKFNMEFDHENVIVNLDKKGVWEKTDNVIKNSKMKGIPIYDGIDGQTIIIFVGPKDGFVDVHTHDYDEILICLRGEFTCIKNDNEVSVVKPLESIHIKKDTPHKVKLLDDCEILTIWNSPKQ